MRKSRRIISIFPAPVRPRPMGWTPPEALDRPLPAEKPYH